MKLSGLIKSGRKGTVICDIDGTIANNKHRSHHMEGSPKNWMAFYAGMAGDWPVIPVINTFNALQEAGYAGVICTGRPHNYRETTVQWLKENYVRHEK